MLKMVMLKTIFNGYCLSRNEILEEAAWPSGQRVGLAIQRSRVRVPLWPLARYVSRNARVQIVGHTCK